MITDAVLSDDSRLRLSRWYPAAKSLADVPRLLPRAVESGARRHSRFSQGIAMEKALAKRTRKNARRLALA